MSGLKREDEYRLKELTQLAEEKGRSNLAESDMLMLSLLEDRYNKFLDEGLRKLREVATSPRGIRGLFSSGRSTPKDAPIADLPSSASPLDAPSLSSGSFATSSPYQLVAPLQGPGKHWTWIMDNLVVGAIPYASPTTDTPGHLCELNEQCFQRKCRIAAVVSCLDVEEPIPQGFALAKDWETQLSTNTFFHVTCLPKGDDGLSIDDDLEVDVSPSPQPGDDAAASGPLPSDPTFEEILTVCQNIRKLCEPEEASGKRGDKSDGIRHRLSIVGSQRERKKVIFVHCKAGLARSWAFAMCYLVSQFQKSFEEANQYLKLLRPFDPKPCHVSFVKKFIAYVTSPRFAAQTDEEEKYVRVLADVLSMSPKYRLKLLQDLEKLT